MKLINTHVNITKLKKKLPQTKIASFFFILKVKNKYIVYKEKSLSIREIFIKLEKYTKQK